MPMPISKRPSLSTDSECASHAVVQAGRTGEAYTQVRADPYFGELRCEGQRRAWRRLPSGDVGHQQRRVAAVCDATNPISPGPQVSCERANDPEPERSGHGRGHFSSFDRRSGALIADSTTHNTSPSRLENVRLPGGAKFIVLRASGGSRGRVGGVARRVAAGCVPLRPPGSIKGSMPLRSARGRRPSDRPTAGSLRTRPTPPFAPFARGTRTRSAAPFAFRPPVLKLAPAPRVSAAPSSVFRPRWRIRP